MTTSTPAGASCSTDRRFSVDALGVITMALLAGPPESSEAHTARQGRQVEVRKSSSRRPVDRSTCTSEPSGVVPSMPEGTPEGTLRRRR